MSEIFYVISHEATKTVLGVFDNYRDVNHALDMCMSEYGEIFKVKKFSKNYLEPFI